MNAPLQVHLDEKAEQFLAYLASTNQRLDDQERQIKELWRRIHSLSEMLEEQGQR